MEISQVAPELHTPTRLIQGFLKLMPLRARTSKAQSAFSAMMRRLPALPSGDVRTQRVPGVGRLFLPAQRRSKGALLWIHGGGFVAGFAAQDDSICRHTARAVGVPVLSVEYRLATAQPFPAALDDCQSAWEWLHRSATLLEIDPERIAIGGQSAGGGLAATLVQRVHDGPGPRAVAQWLFCPMLDDRTAARRELDGLGHFVWDNRKNALGWGTYLAVEPGALELPPYAAAARRKELRGLPPAWVGVGDIDLFFAEDRDYAQRLTDAGVATTFEVVPGAPHGFEAWARWTRISTDYLGKAQRWLEGALSR
jgi:acetyl esterase/lipase